MEASSLGEQPVLYKNICLGRSGSLAMPYLPRYLLFSATGCLGF
jgi:hypothetical protein